MSKEMKRVIDKKLCTGCTTCYNSCPVDAIKMIEEDDGFKYAYIDEDKCINCGLCKRVCPILNNNNLFNNLNKVYAAYNQNVQSRLKSSSGGIFPLLARYIIEDGGVVVACMLENMKPKHVIIDRIEDIDLLRGSKYIQSDLQTIFKNVKDFAKKGKVLFVGTPCQVAGIKNYLKNNNNLYTCDLVCHGIASYKYFYKYLKDKYPNEKIVDYKFKDKRKSWKNYDVYIKTEKKEYIENVNNNEFMIGYLNNCYIRESCFNCRFKGKNRVGDITLGDFWGINKIDKSLDDDKGTSLVLINTEKGKEIFNKIKSDLIFKEESIDNAIKYNPAIINSVKDNNSDSFNESLKNLSFLDSVKKYKKKKLKTRIKEIIIRIKK